MISLAGIVLSNDLRLQGLENSSGIVYSQKRTILGKQVLHVALNIKGRDLSLIGNLGDYTQEIIDQLKVIEQNGTPVVLVHPKGVFSVLIVDMTMEQATQNPEPSSDEWYSGEIKMIEV